MRVGSFLLAGQYPGQEQTEALSRAIRTAEVTEESGLDSVWLAEHHFVPYGVCPSATTLAGYLLGRTRRITIGTAVSVLPTAHPVSLGEQAALLHLASHGRFTLGVGRGGPWIDLRVFGGGLDAYENGFPEALDLLMRWLNEAEVGADGERYAFPPVPVVPRPRHAHRVAERGSAVTGSVPAADRGTGNADGGDGPPVLVACTSPRTVRLAAARGLPMLLGMHIGDDEKAEMVGAWRDAARSAGVSPELVDNAPHVSAGVVQVADSQSEAVSALRQALPGWLRQGLAAHQTVDGRQRSMRDPHAYTERLCELHPVGSPQLCADRLQATAETTGIERFALLVEGTGSVEETEQNVRRLGADVLPLVPQPRAGSAPDGVSGTAGLADPKRGAGLDPGSGPAGRPPPAGGSSGADGRTATSPVVSGEAAIVPSGR